MPLVQIHMAEGRSDVQKRALLEAVTLAVHKSLPTPMNTIRVWVSEFPGHEYMVAGEIYAEQDTATAKASGSAGNRNVR